MAASVWMPGTKVHYKPSHGKIENGIIKSVVLDAWSSEPQAAFVVYKCGGDWDNYTIYTGVRSQITNLRLGWALTLNLKNILNQK